MTKQRPPCSFELALAQIAGLIGWETAASIVGQAERTVRNWSDPDTSAAIRMDDALRLDLAYRAAGGDGAPMLNCYATRLEAASVAANLCSEKLAQNSATAAREAGEATAALVLASRPGATAVQREIAKREVQQAVDAFISTLPMLDGAGPSGGSDAAPRGGER